MMTLLRLRTRPLRTVGFTVSLLAAFGSLQLIGAEQPLQVALLSGASDRPAYQTDKMFALLKEHLESKYAVECTLLEYDDATQGFHRIEALRDADAAVVFVRRKTPNPHNLSILKDFFASGKGVVALRATTHAWENWTNFDREVLGAGYGGRKNGNFGKVQSITFHDHPIWTGALNFSTELDTYNMVDFAPEVQVIADATNERGTMPVAWTRLHQGGKVFTFTLGAKQDFQKPSYLKIVANALLWVTDREIPGAETLVQRTIMPEAHPSSFAVAFPSGTALCFDPVRGGVSYAWQGTVDLRPTWNSKLLRPAAVRGEVYYREGDATPLRIGSPDRIPLLEFLGYRLNGDYPEFRYTIDGQEVREELRPLPGGGLERRFEVQGASAPIWFKPGSSFSGQIEVSGARPDGAAGYRLDPDGSATFAVRLAP